MINGSYKKQEINDIETKNVILLPRSLKFKITQNRLELIQKGISIHVSKQ